MLGEAFYVKFKQFHNLKCTDIDVNEDWLSFLDFRGFDNYKKDVNDFRPDWLFHLGAYTDLEYCERHKKDTYLTNTESVKHAVKIANVLNIPILYISTAGIFDGKIDEYDDWAEPNPINHYGRSKYLAEKYVYNYSKKHLILRAGWMMGGGINKDKKFVGKIIQQIKNKKKILNIVDDKYGTPTYTIDFAKNSKLILEKKLWGVYNLVCDETTSRIAVAKKILEILCLEDKIKINKVKSSFFKDTYFAPRPFSEKLISKKLKLRNLYIMRSWQVCLDEYIRNNFI